MTFLNTDAVAPFYATRQTPLKFNSNKNTLPLAQTALDFGSKTQKHPTTLQNARQQARMLMTIPVLLGVNGMAYMAGADEPQLIVIHQNGKKINLSA
jgi:hypothetical protein